MDELKPKMKLRKLAGLSIDEVREDKKQRQAKVLEKKIEAQLAEEKRNRMNIVNLQKHQQQYKEVNTNDTNI